jgi:Mg-chelatase subunit ChlD
MRAGILAAQLAVWAALSLSGLAARAEEKSEAKASQIEVCFVLDTTGSMGGLIEGAKQKIWSIANQIVSAKPAPNLKIGLIGYRDRGDDYVTKVFDLSEDIDAVYANLKQFQAGGGGDEPESVNQALSDAIGRMSWSSDRNVLKIVFLVGDAPPHMDYAQDVKYQQICQAAVRKDLIVNTIQCGVNTRTTPVWQEIAKLAEGSYVAIGQSGDMQIVSTPIDGELADLNAKLGTTMVAYGRADERAGVRAKQMMAESMAAPAAAERMAYNRSSGKVVQGKGDLVDDLASGSVKLEGLEKEQLPEELKGKSKPEQEQFLKDQSEKRKEIQAKVDTLLKQRQAYLDEQQRKQAQAGGGSAFDKKVFEILREQAGRKGLRY